MVATRDAGAYPLVFQLLQCFSEPVGVITAAPKQPVDPWQTAEHGPCADVIVHLTGSDEQAERLPLLSQTACSLVFMPPLVRPIRRPRPPTFFDAHAGRCSVALEIGLPEGN